MGDRFYKDIEVPNVTDSSAIGTNDPNFISVYAKDGKLASKDADNVETVYGVGSTTTELRVDGGMAATTFNNYLLRLDFGSGGATINPTGTP